jgi:hypothetical protein
VASECGNQHILSTSFPSSHSALRSFDHVRAYGSGSTLSTETKDWEVEHQSIPMTSGDLPESNAMKAPVRRGIRPVLFT